MKRFEAFVRDDTERETQKAEEALTTAVQALAGLAIGFQPIADSLREVKLHDRALARAIRRALASARVRRFAVRRRLARNEQAAIRASEPVPVEAVSAVEAQIRAYADDLQKAATGDERKTLEAERQELADRATLQAQMPIIKVEIKRIKAIRFLDDCLADTTTNAINQTWKQYRRCSPHASLARQVAEELIGLVGAQIRVEMVRAGG